MHNPIFIRDLSVVFANKICFENFNAQINFGDRIAITGRNGAGKSSLLKALMHKDTNFVGNSVLADDVQIGYVPQIMTHTTQLSGGEAFNQALTQALSTYPNLLILDEPTNHLDQKNRRSLLKLLKHFYGTLIIVSHDEQLLNEVGEQFWHLDHQQINIFTGQYTHYLQSLAQQKQKLSTEIKQLKQQQKHCHAKLMREQKRAASSKKQGQKNIDNRKWATVVSKAKTDRANATSNQNKYAIKQQKQHTMEQLTQLSEQDTILPSFSITPGQLTQQTLLTINNGSIAYEHQSPIVQQIYLQLQMGQRLALIGRNGSGKTTLLKAILDDKHIIKTGEWWVPNIDRISYMDQNYQSLQPQYNALETLQALKPEWDEAKIRQHLQTFLFRTNTEISLPTNQLSGGEKARLCLAQLAAKNPDLLILDEVTNNLDRETKAHLLQVLQAFPGAILMVCHEQGFLDGLGIKALWHMPAN